MANNSTSIKIFKILAISLATSILVLLVFILAILNSAPLFNQALAILAPRTNLWAHTGDVSFSPIGLKFQLEDLVIYEDSRKVKDLITAKKLSIKLNYAMQGIEAITLENANVNLIIDEQKKWNWSILEGGGGNQNSSATAKQNSPAPEDDKSELTDSKPSSKKDSRRFFINNVQIKDSFFSFKNEASPLGVTLKDLNLSVAELNTEKLINIQTKTYLHYYQGQSFFINGNLDGVLGVWYQSHINQLRIDADSDVGNLAASFLKTVTEKSHLDLAFVCDFENNEFRWDDALISWGNQTTLRLRGKVASKIKGGPVFTTVHLKTNDLNDALGLFDVKISQTIKPDIYTFLRYDSAQKGVFLDWASIKINESKILLNSYVKNLGSNNGPDFSIKLTGVDKSPQKNLNSFNIELLEAKNPLSVKAEAKGSFNDFNLNIPYFKIGKTEFKIDSRQNIRNGNLLANFRLDIKSRDLSEVYQLFKIPPNRWLNQVNQAHLSLAGKLDSAKKSLMLNKLNLNAESYNLSGSLNFKNWQNWHNLTANLQLKDTAQPNFLLTLAATPADETTNTSKINAKLAGQHVNAALKAQLTPDPANKFFYNAALDAKITNLKQLLMEYPTLVNNITLPEEVIQINLIAKGDMNQVDIEKINLSALNAVFSISDAKIVWKGRKQIAARALIQKLDIKDLLAAVNAVNREPASKIITSTEKLTPDNSSRKYSSNGSDIIIQKLVKNFLDDYLLNLSLNTNNITFDKNQLPDFLIKVANKNQQLTLNLTLEYLKALKLESDARLDLSVSPYIWNLKIVSPAQNLTLSAHNQSITSDNIALSLEAASLGNSVADLVKNLNLKGNLQILGLNLTDNKNKNYRTNLSLNAHAKEGVLNAECVKCNFVSSQTAVVNEIFNIESVNLAELLNGKLHAEKIILADSKISLIQPLKNDAPANTSQFAANQMQLLENLPAIIMPALNLESLNFDDIAVFKIRKLNINGFDLWNSNLEDTNFTRYSLYPLNWENVSLENNQQLEMGVAVNQGSALTTPGHTVELDELFANYQTAQTPKLEVLGRFDFLVNKAANHLEIVETVMLKNQLSDGEKYKQYLTPNYVIQDKDGLLATIKGRQQIFFNQDRLSKGILAINLPDYSPVANLYVKNKKPLGEVFAIIADINYEINKLNSSVTAKNIKFGQADLDLNFNYQQSENNQPQRLDLALESKNLDNSLKKILALHDINTARSNTFNPFKLDINLIRQNSRLTGNNTFKIGESMLRTRLDINEDNKYALRAEIDKLDIDNWLPTNGKDVNKDPAPKDNNASKDGLSNFGRQAKKFLNDQDLIDKEKIKKYDVEADFSIGKLTWHDEGFEDFNLSFNLKQGQGKIENLSLTQISGGKLESKAAVNFNMDMPVWEWNTKISEVDLKKIANFINSDAIQTGIVDVGLNVNSTGNSTNDHLANLKAVLDIKASQIKSDKVSTKSLCLLNSYFRSFFVDESFKKLDIRDMSIKTTAKEGIVRIEELDAQLSNSDLLIRKNPILDFNSGEIDMNVIIKVEKNKTSRPLDPCEPRVIAIKKEVRYICRGNFFKQEWGDICGMPIVDLLIGLWKRTISF